MKYFRLSYDTRQLSRKNIELINQTIIKKLEEKGFSVPEETQITLDFPIPNSLNHYQHIFFSIKNSIYNNEKELFFRRMAREYFELINLNVGISRMGTYDLYLDEETYQREVKLINDNYLIATADHEDENYIKSILDSNEFLKNWLEKTGQSPI
ncbi:hypothetical protein [Rodentibacter pneumotropicus]|uniref:hypothetical protein n=1 Tax=Rodentibacter pneumotropicus TaxID=758 RepID=UPI00037D1182|nr:hypothetical protein [Rodentibacter pneumotropicus]NBH74730.1 hypothetical protein [Rodentibacter pneumotropicus]THA11918.1 hypothetical protein D3M82_11050 [Rodentibacter pneumotropicus]